MKSTYALINDIERLLFKDPITDNGTKKSLKGLCIVGKLEDGTITVVDNLEMDIYEGILYKDIMKTVYKDGKAMNLTTLAEQPTLYLILCEILTFAYNR